MRGHKPPVDKLDSLFMYHDWGYEMHQYRLADRVLVREIDQLPVNDLSWKAYLYSRAARKYFSVTGGGSATDDEVRQLHAMVAPHVQQYLPAVQQKLPAENFSSHSITTPHIANPFSHDMPPKRSKSISSKRAATPVKGATPSFAARNRSRSQPPPRRARSRSRFAFAPPRRGRRRRNTRSAQRAGSFKIVAPVATTVLPTVHTTVTVNGKKVETLLLDCHELFADVKCPNDGKYSAGTVLFNVPFNPSVFPNMVRLNSFARLYNQYETVELWMMIKGIGNSGATGSWYAFWDTDPQDDPSQFTEDKRHSMADAHNGVKDGSWWGGQWTVKAPIKKKQLWYTNPATSDILWNCSHRFVLGTTATAGLTPDGTVLTLRCFALLRYYGPSIEPLYLPPTGTTGSFHATHAGTPSPSSPFGPQANGGPLKVDGSVVITLVTVEPTTAPPPNVLYKFWSGAGWRIFLPLGSRWLLTWQNAGTVLSALTLSEVDCTVVYGNTTVNNGATGLVAISVLQADSSDLPQINPFVSATTVTSTILRMAPVDSSLTKPSCHGKDPFSARLRSTLVDLLQEFGLSSRATEQDHKEPTYLLRHDDEEYFESLESTRRGITDRKSVRLTTR